MSVTEIRPKHGLLRVGHRVHCILYGGKDGVIYEIHGEQSPLTCGTVAGIMVTGGNADLDIVWENGTESKRIPESLVRGSVQWRILPGFADATEIAQLRANAVDELAKRTKAADEAAAKFKAEVEALKVNPAYKHLEQGQDDSSGKLAAANIRKELKLAFPGTKFSVTKRHYGSVSVSWVDGPGKAVNKITDKYKSAHFDGMNDLESSTVSPFNTVYGGSKYVSLGRESSQAAYIRATMYVTEKTGLPLLEIESHDGGVTGYVKSTDTSNAQTKFKFYNDDGELVICSCPEGGDYHRELVNSVAHFVKGDRRW